MNPYTAPQGADQSPMQQPMPPANAPYPAAPRRSAMAVTSLVLGIVALVLSWMPIINNFSFILAVLGIIFAIIGLVGISRGKKTGKGLAIAGLVLGIVSFVIVIATQSMYSSALDEAMANLNTPAASSSAGASTNASATDAATDSSSAAGSSSSDSSQPAYAVTIDSCVQSTDYQGEPCVVVTYTWTNNSDEATSFLVAINADAYQNGVELDTAIGAEGADSGSTMKDVKPGSTATVTMAYALDDTSDVTVECSELFNWGSDELLAEQTFSL